MICYWLPLSKVLIDKGIHFSYTIDHNKVEFNDKSSCSFSVDLIMNDKDSFSLSKNSVIYYYDNYKEKMVPHSYNEDKLYYLVISILAEKPYERISEYRMDSLRYNYNKINIENTYLYSNLSLKELFIDQNYPLVSLIWNLIYTLPETIIKQLSNLLDTIESELLLFHSNSFRSMNLSNFNDVIELTKWAKLFDNKTKVLRNILDDPNFNRNNKDTEKTIKDIEEEIRYFKSAPNKLNNFWSSDSLLKLYQSKLDEYYKILDDEEKKSQELTNKRTIRNLKEQLHYQNVSKEFKQMKEDLISQLDMITEYTDDICKSAKKIVDQFIADSTMKEVNDSNIVWPDISTNRTYSYNSYSKYNSENIKLFEELIWYSKIKSLLTEIEKGQNVLNNIRKLNEFKEMSNPKELFLSKLLQNPDSKEIIDDSALHTLNAHMIHKLYEINPKFISNPDIIYDIINKYMNRYAMSDEEYRWVYSNKHSSDIILSIPKFEPKDFIFLMINKKSENKYCYGPMFKVIYHEYFLNNIKEFIHSNFSSYFDAIYKVAQKAYSLFIDSTNNSEFHNFDELRKAYKNIEIYKLRYENDKKTITEIKKLIEIAE